MKKEDTKQVEQPANDAAPKGIKIQTQLTPEDIETGEPPVCSPDICLEEIEESVVMTNPDVDSMESRG